MPITKSKAFVTSDGQLFVTREAAQKHELEILFKDDASASPPEIAGTIITKRTEVLAILSDRKPRVPKVKSAGRPRRNAAVNAATQPTS